MDIPLLFRAIRQCCAGPLRQAGCLWCECLLVSYVRRAGVRDLCAARHRRLRRVRDLPRRLRRSPRADPDRRGWQAHPLWPADPGVCLSQPAFLEQIAAKLRAGVQTYRPAGIWLDYLAYPGWFEVPDPDLQESCFCPGCIATFCERTGIDAPTPAEILARYGSAWTRHKCAQIAAFAAQYAQIIRAELPRLRDRRIYVPLDARGVRRRRWPLIGSPPMPTLVEMPIPSSFICEAAS